jgi:hypothetical protein
MDDSIHKSLAGKLGPSQEKRGQEGKRQRTSDRHAETRKESKNAWLSSGDKISAIRGRSW